MFKYEETVINAYKYFGSNPFSLDDYVEKVKEDNRTKNAIRSSFDTAMWMRRHYVVFDVWPAKIGPYGYYKRNSDKKYILSVLGLFFLEERGIKLSENDIKKCAYYSLVESDYYSESTSGYDVVIWLLKFEKDYNGGVLDSI